MMNASLKRNLLSLTFLAVFIVTIPAAAQYAGTTGDIPPVFDSYRLDVVATHPCSSAFGIPSVPGITDKEVQRMENPGEDEIIYSRDGVTIACLEYLERRYDFAYVFKGEWGLNYEVFDNEVCISQLSPSGRYYAVGSDGTGTSRGPVYVFDLETGVKYCTTPSSVWSCSDWIEGDYLLIVSSGYSASNIEMWMNDDLGSIAWMNSSYLTEAQGGSNDFVLYHGGSSWMILPEDRYYNYNSKGIPGLCENGIFFDVIAEANVIPSLAGIEYRSDFREWIDSAGGYDTAFPRFDFRVYVDTRTNSVSDIRQMDPGMVVEGFLNAAAGRSFAGILDYLTALHRGAILYEHREETENILRHFPGFEYRICEVSKDGDRADVTSELILLGYRAGNRFTLVNDNGRWRIDDWMFDDEFSVISGNRTYGWFSPLPLIETILKTFSSMIFRN